jgi:hypothetical protein
VPRRAQVSKQVNSEQNIAQFSESFSVQSGIMPRPTKSRCNHFCPTPGDLDHPATFDLLITPTDLQRRAFGLIDQITV